MLIFGQNAKSPRLSLHHEHDEVTPDGEVFNAAAAVIKIITFQPKLANVGSGRMRMQDFRLIDMQCQGNCCQMGKSCRQH